MKWMDCPKNPFMACSREGCTTFGCVLLQPIKNEPWPSPDYIPRPREPGAVVFNAQEALAELEKRVKALEEGRT